MANGPNASERVKKFLADPSNNDVLFPVLIDPTGNGVPKKAALNKANKRKLEELGWDDSSNDSSSSSSTTSWTSSDSEDDTNCNTIDTDRIGTAILTHYENNKLTDELEKRRKRFFSDLVSAARSLYPDGRLLLFGSSATGLCHRKSDLDVSLLVEPHDDPKGVLRRLKTVISRIARIQFIQNARVPILKCTGKSTPYQFDVSCNRPEGGWNAALVSKFISMDPRVSPALFYLHELLDCSGVKNSRLQLLSAFSINISFVHYLQSVAQPAVLPFLRYKVPSLSTDFRHRNVVFTDVCDDFTKENTESVGSLVHGYLTWLTNAVKKSLVQKRRSWLDIRHHADRTEEVAWVGTNDGGLGIVNPVDPTHNVTANIKAKQWQTILSCLQAIQKRLADTQSYDPTYVGGMVSRRHNPSATTGMAFAQNRFKKHQLHMEKKRAKKQEKKKIQKDKRVQKHAVVKKAQEVRHPLHFTNTARGPPRKNTAAPVRKKVKYE